MQNAGAAQDTLKAEAPCSNLAGSLQAVPGTILTGRLPDRPA
jgi:hypothetical protein